MVNVNPTFKYSILAIPAGILTFTLYFDDPINFPKLLAIIPFSVTSVVLFLSLRKYTTTRTHSSKKNLINGLYLAVGIGMILFGFLGSSNWVRVLFGAPGRNNGVLYYICVISIALILVNLRIGKDELDYLTKTIIFTAVLFGTYSLVQFLDKDPVSWVNPYVSVIGTVGNPNFAASILGSFSVFFLYLLLNWKHYRLLTNSFLTTTAILLAFLAWRTESLQGLLVIAVGIGLIAYSYFERICQSKTFPRLFLVGGIGVLILAFTSFLGLGPWGGSLEQYTLKLRGWYAWFGIKAMLDSPFTGFGVDNYDNAFRRFRTEEFVATYGSNLASNNAHSTPIQVGASFGVVVFVLYLMLQMIILYKSLKLLGTNVSSFDSIKGISIIWILIFSQSLLSIENIGLGVLNWLLGAVILSVPINSSLGDVRGVNRELKKTVLPVWTGIVPIVSISLCIASMVPIAREDKAYQVVSLAEIKNSEDIQFAKESYKKLSAITLYNAQKLDRIVGNLFNVGLEREAGEAIRELYSLNENDVYSSDLLATFYSNSNLLEAEIELRERMRNLDPWNSKLELALAKAYSRAGFQDKLALSVERVKSSYPDSETYNSALSLLNNPTPEP